MSWTNEELEGFWQDSQSARVVERHTDTKPDGRYFMVVRDPTGLGTKAYERRQRETVWAEVTHAPVKATLSTK